MEEPLVLIYPLLGAFMSSFQIIYINIMSSHKRWTMRFVYYYLFSPSTTIDGDEM